MIHLPYDTCFGCYGCENACPKQAINMEPDKYGYKHPLIDPQKCVECHLCEKVCTSLNHLELKKPRKVLAAATKDSNELTTVASGGLCTELSRLILTDGGVVYGCCEKNYTDIHHVRVDNVAGLDMLKKSKYVFSDIGQTFSMAKKDLMDGKKVLFIGTPCQISGLLGYLRKPYGNLYTVDLVCHGVPSQQMLQDHINSLPVTSKIDKNKIKVDFRWKSRYGIRYGIRFGIGGGKTYECHESVDPYMAAFHYGISYRENCFSCPFATDKRIGDITAADFWGIGKSVPSKFIDVNGVSMVILNSEKGETLFNRISHLFDVEEHTMEEAKLNNSNLSHPSIRLPLRDEFLRIYTEKGIRQAAHACLPTYRKNTNPIYRALISIPGLTKAYAIIKKIIKR